MRYQITKGPDGIAWVTIQPLLQDCREILDNAVNIDTETMTEAEKMGHDTTIIAIKSVIEFLNSLMIEFNMNNREDTKDAEDDSRQTVH